MRMAWYFKQPGWIAGGGYAVQGLDVKVKFQDSGKEEEWDCVEAALEDAKEVADPEGPEEEEMPDEAETVTVELERESTLEESEGDVASEESEG